MCQPFDIKQSVSQSLNPLPADVPQVALNVETKLEPKPGVSANCNERNFSQQEIQRIKSENAVRKIPRKIFFGEDIFFISYTHRIFSGKYSIHHVVRESDKRLFSIKIDDRDPAMILRDENVRSKLVGVDFPKIIHSERQSSVTCNVMEPLSMTFKELIRRLSMKRENNALNSAILLRIGRMCIRLLEKLHDNGILHGNINPHTFILPCDSDKKKGKTDLERGPLIIDFSHAIDSNEDPLYKEETPETRFNSAIYAEDGGIYTKRDDMENLGYLLLFLANGRIAWEVRKRRDQLLFGNRCLSELSRNIRGIPLLIKNYLTYVRTIKWNATPDYQLLDLCLVNKNLDIRAEIKARRDRLKLRRKRKRVSVAHGELQGNNIGENGLTAHVEHSTTSKKRLLDPSWTFHGNSKAAEHGPEYFELSLQMLPKIAVKFKNRDRESPSTSSIRTFRRCLARNMDAVGKINVDLNHRMPDQFFTRPAGDNSKQGLEDAFFSIGCENEVLVTKAKNTESECSADTNQQNFLFSSESRSKQTSSLRHYEQSHSVLGITADNIQFHFPFLPSDSDDELRHPWEQELGSLAFSRP